MKSPLNPPQGDSMRKNSLPFYVWRRSQNLFHIYRYLNEKTDASERYGDEWFLTYKEAQQRVYELNGKYLNGKT